MGRANQERGGNRGTQRSDDRHRDRSIASSRMDLREIMNANKPALPRGELDDSRHRSDIDSRLFRAEPSHGGCIRKPQQRSIDWNVVLEQPDRLHFVENGPELEASVFHRDTIELPPIHSPHRKPHAAFSWSEQPIDGRSLKSIVSHRRDSSHPPEERFPTAYWVLGKLGPDMQDPDRIQKQHVYDHVKEFSDRVNRVNMSTKRRPERHYIEAPKRQASCRTRALQYSKSIRRPMNGTSCDRSSQKAHEEKRVFSELQRLEREHQLHKERMQAIEAEMRRRGI